MWFPERAYFVLPSLILISIQNIQLYANAKKYGMVPGTMLKQPYIVSSSTLSSKLECVAICSLTPPCIAVSWSERLHLCHSSNHEVRRKWWNVDNPVLQGDTEWVTYRDMLYPVRPYEDPDGAQRLTFEQAKQLCLNRGTVLATKAQLLAARELGLSHCSCGWLADGTQGYILDAPNKRCVSEFNTGIIKCSSSREYADAWCVLI